MDAANPNVFPADWPMDSLSGWGIWDAHSVEVEDLFDAWVFAARDAELALDAWAWGTDHERATAHAVYRAALDREERAAEVLAIAASSHGSPVADDGANGESTAAPASPVRESSPGVAGRASMRQAAVRPARREQDKPRR